MWKAAGLNLEEGAFSPESAAKGKKLALVTLYKAWSAFSKGLRHTFCDKQRPVTIPKIGSFFNVSEGGSEVQIFFCASNQLQRIMGFEEDKHSLMLESSVSSQMTPLNWMQIARATEAVSAEIVQLFVY